MLNLGNFSSLSWKLDNPSCHSNENGANGSGRTGPPVSNGLKSHHNNGIIRKESSSSLQIPGLLRRAHSDSKTIDDPNSKKVVSLAWAYFSTEHFEKRHFGKRHFGTMTFRHKNISAWVFFGTMDTSARVFYNIGTFRHKDISTNGHFAKGIFF